MKTYAPNYYKDFRCIAGECRHSCCIGWDVYIDNDTLCKYEKMGGKLGGLVRAHLCEKEDGICFEMRENGHCPFLNERGLCDIILEKGEDFISEICTEHPRFYNFFSDREEVGLGLSCEEAARIILSQEEKFSLFLLDDDGGEEKTSQRDKKFFAWREKIFEVLQDRKMPIDERARKMLAIAGAKFPQKSPREWADILRGLEIMDPEWEKALCALCEPCFGGDVSEHDTAFENLLIYFIYRHTAGAFDDTELAARVCFAYLGFRVIRALCLAKKASSGECTFEDLCDFARRYSAEIEYSPENTGALIEIMEV
ncbi:MAG: flagellin lysine-N-methylase [Clostridia bacterium]|nr:flagellin lysine-N-methylase [Clostridia bacterium]